MGLLRPLRIGDVTLPNNLVLSPMAGITDLPFRALCRTRGAGLVCTEMVAAHALVQDAHRALRRRDTTPWERPVSIQIVGNEPASVGEAAARLSAHCDVLGLNLGCPAHQVASAGCGAALLDDPDTAVALVRAIKERGSRPLLAKMRVGTRSVMDVAAFARRLESAGADALIVHGRTAAQSYRGRADWGLIGRVKDAVAIPVIGNGDIRSGADAARALEESGCDGVAIGRGAMGDPRLFARVQAYLARGEALPLPTDTERLADFKAYATMARDADLPHSQVLVHAQAFSRGMRGAARLRKALQDARSAPEMVACFEAHVAEREARERHLDETPLDLGTRAPA